MAAEQPCSEAHFRQMGSDAQVIVIGDDHASLLEQARARLRSLEATWSRFDPASEISVINRSSDTVFVVSEDTRTLIARSLDARFQTDGRFDPTVLGDVIRNGYDRAIEEVDGRRGRSMLIAGDLRLDGPVLVRSENAGIDPGGIGKGLGADLVVEELMDSGAEGACVNLGGDLRAEGVSPDGRGWTFTIDHPNRAQPLSTIGIEGGAVATSTSLLRAWGSDGRHHIVDPSTGGSSHSGVEFVSVIAGRAWIAEAHAKSVMVGGIAAFEALSGEDLAALAVDTRGTAHTTPNFSLFSGGLTPTRSLMGART